MAKILFTHVEPWEKNFLRKHLQKHKLIFLPETPDAHELSRYRDTTILAPFIYFQIDKTVLAKFPKLKLIATRSTGFNHIDLRACKKRGIIVCNVPTYGENTVAEHTFALILALSRKVYTAYMRMQRGRYDLDGLQGFDLQGKTLGVVGCGYIGSHVVRIAKAFEMNVIVYEPTCDPIKAKALVFQYVSFPALLKQSDIVTLHCPLCPQTHHLINKKNIFTMKKGALLINTARGSIVETGALYQAIMKKHLAGAGLDVFEEEKSFLNEERELLSTSFRGANRMKILLENHAFLHHEDVIITPHNAFNSREAVERILETTVSNIQGFLAKKPQNVVLSS